MRFILSIHKMAVTISTRDVGFEGMYIRWDPGSDFGTTRLTASARPIRQVHVLGDGPQASSAATEMKNGLLTGRL